MVQIPWHGRVSTCKRKYRKRKVRYLEVSLIIVADGAATVSIVTRLFEDVVHGQVFDSSIKCNLCIVKIRSVFGCLIDGSKTGGKNTLRIRFKVR